MPDDDAFLQELYFTTRDDLDGIFPDEEQKRQLLLIQYKGQTLTYANQFPDASHDVIELDGEPVGRLMVSRQRDAVQCVDISLRPEMRNIGIGTIVLRDLLAESTSRGLPCVLQVLKANPARHLYERLGFTIEGDDGMRFFMKWTPTAKESGIGEE